LVPSRFRLVPSVSLAAAMMMTMPSASQAVMTRIASRRQLSPLLSPPSLGRQVLDARCQSTMTTTTTVSQQPTTTMSRQPTTTTVWRHRRSLQRR
jgi:hypothetical protein